MRKLLFFHYFVFVAAIAIVLPNTSCAQCFNKNFRAGTSAMNQKNYEVAKKYFETALECNDANDQGKKQARSKIQECVRHIKPVTTTTSSPVTKAKVEWISYSGKQSKNEEGYSGLRVTAKSYVNGLKGKTVYLKCAVKSHKPANPEFEAYSLNAGEYAGQMKSFYVSSDKETIEMDFFIPFIEIAFENYYSQPFDVALEVLCDGKTIENAVINRSIKNITPYTATISNLNIQMNIPNNLGENQMCFHFDLETKGMKGLDIQVLALFYQSDGRTKLLNDEGKWINSYGYSTAAYDISRWSDFNFCIKNIDIMGSNAWGKEVKFYLVVSFDHGETWVSREGPYTFSW